MYTSPYRTAFLILSISGAIAVLLGAFGAHALKNLVSEDSIQVWKTASFYHFVHVLAALLCLVLPGRRRHKRWAYHLFLWGTVCFSGSLYLLSTTAAHQLSVSFLGPITPIGGLLLTTAWLLMAWSIYQGDTERVDSPA